MPNDKIVTLREITKETVRSITNLEVAENQKCFVATNAISIAQAYFEEKAWFRAIYADDDPVGFVMLYIDTEKPEYYLWRYMIDKNQQKHNYGYQAMKFVIEHVRSFNNAREMKLSYVPGDGDPSGFYKKLGFVDTDEWDEGERVMVLML
jgi:diamine N-acetyltransferase